LNGATPDPLEPSRNDDGLARLKLTEALGRAKYAIAWERAWPPLARLLTVAGLFLVVSWAGLWLSLPSLARAICFALFVLLALVAIWPILRFRWPSREQALTRLDKGSGIRHRPATTLADTLTTHDPFARALWQAQRERTLASLKRIRAGLPSPRLALQDPWALRALVVVLLVATYVAAGDERTMRVAAALDWEGVLSPANIRVDAWVNPPPYTARPPIILSAANKEASLPTSGPLSVPAGSTLIVRSSGASLDVTASGGLTEVAGKSKRLPAPTRSILRSQATARRTFVRRPVSRSGASPPFPTVHQPFRLPKIRSGRRVAGCSCPTSSRMTTGSPKRRRILPRVRRRARRPAQRRGRCFSRRNLRWCCRMRGPATASARR
jgi:uncharacterized protein (TIGR02302 family)